MIGRRVQCMVQGDLGTVVGWVGGDRYEVEWDRPSLYVSTPRVPSGCFEWAELRTAKEGRDG